MRIEHDATNTTSPKDIALEGEGVSAGSDIILINEVDTGEPEYFELYNPGASAIDICDWIITIWQNGASAADSIVEIVFNDNPSKVKQYRSLSIEGNAAWDAVVSNSDQSASISKTSVTAGGVTYPYGDYEKLERGYFAEIPKDSSANTLSSGNITSLTGTSEVFPLGAVATSGVSGDTITFTTPVGDIPFPIGGALYKVGSGQLEPLSLTVSSAAGAVVTCNTTVTGVSDADEIVVLASGAVEGDNIRDYYAKVKLTNASTSVVELYAINGIYSESSLHNELGS